MSETGIARDIENGRRIISALESGLRFFGADKSIGTDRIRRDLLMLAESGEVRDLVCQYILCHRISLHSQVGDLAECTLNQPMDADEWKEALAAKGYRAANRQETLDWLASKEAGKQLWVLGETNLDCAGLLRLRSHLLLDACGIVHDKQTADRTGRFSGKSTALVVKM